MDWRKYQSRLSTTLRNDMPYRRGQSKRMLKGLAAERVFWGPYMDIDFELFSRLTSYAINVKHGDPEQHREAGHMATVVKNGNSSTNS